MTTPRSCPWCEGSGRLRRCPTCSGRGITVTDTSGWGGLQACETCSGRRLAPAHPDSGAVQVCPMCDGAGAGSPCGGCDGYGRRLVGMEPQPHPYPDRPAERVRMDVCPDCPGRGPDGSTGRGWIPAPTEHNGF